MPDPQVQLIAFLSNVDHSIAALRLGGNFRIRELPEEGGIALISRLEGVGPEMAYERAEAQFGCLNRREKKFYVALKAYKLSANQIAGIQSNQMLDMTAMLIDNLNLSTKLSLARLFQGGDIRAPLSYGVIINKPELKRLQEDDGVVDKMILLFETFSLLANLIYGRWESEVRGSSPP